jgi:hypothetical protein
VSEVTDKNFGLLIAYLLPGFVLLASVSRFSPILRSWIGTPMSEAATVGDFLYATLASVALGLTVSTIRWLVVDTMHHHTGIPAPQWDFSKLPGRLAAFQGVVDNHFRYYQFYSNMLVALGIVWALSWPKAPGIVPEGRHVLDFAMAATMALFFVGSRDALRKYYARAEAILQVPSTKEPSHDERLPQQRD